jgi:flagellar assembly protein FliH
LSKVLKRVQGLDLNRIQAIAIDGPQVSVVQSNGVGDERDCPTAGPASPAEDVLLAARREADSLLAAAKHSAEQVLAQAQREADQIREQARVEGREAGYQDGWQAGHSECEQSWRERIAQAQAVVEAAQREREHLLQSAQPTITAIAMEAVRVLLHRELALAPADIEQMVGGLLQYVLDGGRVEVRVHPDDFPRAADAHPVWQRAKLGDWEIAVVPDPAIAPGGCEVRSDVGRVDARMETKLELLEQVLRDVLERGES